jgi:5-methylcytosine-specific restriction protein A
MPLPHVTVDSVGQALDEFDSLGRDKFLATHGFGTARRYVILRDGIRYDSKAIVGAAHLYATGTPLASAEFSGGEATVVKLLRELGFDVVPTTSPDWDWQEVVLACALVHTNQWRELRPGDARVQELSILLRKLPIHPEADRPENFRSPDSVSRKTTDLRTARAGYSGKSTRGGKTDKIVLAQFEQDAGHMLEVAEAIRQGLAEGYFDDVVEAKVDHPENAEAEEGGLLMRLHARRERDPKLRAAKIEAVQGTGAGLGCEVCGFDFEVMYGTRGSGYVECHHVVPLHVTGRRKVRLDDLVLICANCHRMIHRGAPWLRPEQLRTVVERSRQQHATATE